MNKLIIEQIKTVNPLIIEQIKTVNPLIIEQIKMQSITLSLRSNTEKLFY